MTWNLIALWDRHLSPSRVVQDDLQKNLGLQEPLVAQLEMRINTKWCQTADAKRLQGTLIGFQQRTSPVIYLYFNLAVPLTDTPIFSPSPLHMDSLSHLHTIRVYSC